jgi:electron transfer flavoprotein beta subunit
MEVCVLVTGVADPKWPLPQVLSLAALNAHAAQYAALSPFDEAALEVALKLRDADASVVVKTLVAGDEALARRVAGWRPDAIHRLDLAAVPRWDGQAVAAALARALQALAPAASLVVVGREFGDFDEGTVPAALAHTMAAPHVALALGVEAAADALNAVRQGSAGLERVVLPSRVLVSVTNDPGNRLRHPLMKNVMLARKMPLPAWSAPSAASPVACERVQPVTAPARAAACEWLEGSSEQKARALARVLAAAAEA